MKIRTKSYIEKLLPEPKPNSEPLLITIKLSQKGCKNCEKCDIRDNYSNHEINSPRLLDGFEADVVESTQSTLYILQEPRP
jgi:hypothetical protein